MRTAFSGLAPARRRLVVVLLGILALVVLVGTGALMAARLRAAPVADQSRPGPVIVVPGYGGRVASVAPIVDELRREDREVVVFEPTQGGRGDLRLQARRLADLVERTIADASAGSVDLVGYSAGGVVARLYVREEGGAARVRRVLSLGSPQHGTDVAALAEEVAGGCPTACEQLATGSVLLSRLNAGDETPDGPRWITVRTDDDQVVTPSVSAELAGALNIRVQDLCPTITASHDDLPDNPVVLATLRSALGVAAPGAPQGVIC